MEKEFKAAGIRVKLDARDNVSQGIKFNEYEQKGVPLRIAVGPRDIDDGVVEVHRRDLKTKEKGVDRKNLAERVKELLEAIQFDLFNRAKNFRNEMTHRANNMDELIETLNNKPGFVRVMWNGDTEFEKVIKEKCKATIRCLPFHTELNKEETPCVFSGEKNNSNLEILVAKAY